MTYRGPLFPHSTSCTRICWIEGYTLPLFFEVFIPILSLYGDIRLDLGIPLREFSLISVYPDTWGSGQLHMLQLNIKDQLILPAMQSLIFTVILKKKAL